MLEQGFKRWSKSVLTENAYTVAAAIVCGALAGLGTYFLKEGIARIGHLLTSRLSISGANLSLLIYPCLGIFLAALFQKCIKENLEHGTAQIRQRLASGNFSFKRGHIFSPLVACFLTVGMGASAGAEGPSAFSGAAIGGRAARWFKLSPDATRILFGCGAAAGIAGIFKSPLGGIFFAIEVLGMELSVIGLVSVTFACLAAFAVAYTLSGFTWTISIIQLYEFNPGHFGWMALMGVVLGLYSVYYSYTQSATNRFFGKINNIWIKCAISGVGMSVIIFLLPSLFGEGYGIVGKTINGLSTQIMAYSPFYGLVDDKWSVLLAICGILLVKGAAVGAANSGGGVAGAFAPTVFAGCIGGYLFAECCNMWFDAGLPTDAFALMGTAATFSGIIKAPVMAIFLVAELSARYSFLLGFMLVAIVSYVVVIAVGGLKAVKADSSAPDGSVPDAGK